jgi:putative membrane protein
VFNATLTTASTAPFRPFRENRFLHLLCMAMAAVIVITGYRPERVFDWWLENAAALSFLAVLTFTYRRLPLSDLSYLLILIYLSGHEWGAEYKYSDVPLGEWMKPWLGTTRNHYDRVMHFSYGLLLAYPMQEWFMRVVGVTSRWRYLLPVEMTLAFSACYEMLESFMASILTPERGEEFVGMQGDMWDSQKDMFMAGLGAITAMIVIAVVRTALSRRNQVASQAAAAGAGYASAATPIAIQRDINRTDTTGSGDER